MEKIYDGTGKSGSVKDENASDDNDRVDEDNLNPLQKEVVSFSPASASLSENVASKNTWQSFHKVPNPTLKLYVYPHLAGNNELPIPGYTTAFNAYEKDHYAFNDD